MKTEVTKKHKHHQRGSKSLMGASLLAVALAVFALSKLFPEVNIWPVALLIAFAVTVLVSHAGKNDKNTSKSVSSEGKN